MVMVMAHGMTNGDGLMAHGMTNGDGDDGHKVMTLPAAVCGTTWSRSVICHQSMVCTLYPSVRPDDQFPEQPERS